MKIAPREQRLLGITIAVVLLAISYLMLEPKFKELGEFRTQRVVLKHRLNKAERLLASQGQVEAQLEEFRKGLPVFPEDKRVEAELLQALEKMAAEKGVVLTRREADPEREAGDLYETSITCHWEGDLDSIVNFLFAQQSQGTVSDVRQLTIRPVGGRGATPDRLKGTFTMDYAYRRETGAIESPVEPAGLEPVEEAAQP